MTREEAARLVAIAVAGSAQGGRLNAGQLADMRDAWAIAMADVPYALAEAALAVAMRTSPFLPSVADLVRGATEITAGPVRAGADAWGDVHRAMSRYGSHRTPGVDFELADPIVAQLVRAFGWRDLCASDNSIADRARFIEAYDALAKQGRREMEAPALGAAREARALVANTARALSGRVPLKLVEIDPGDRPPWDDD